MVGLGGPKGAKRRPKWSQKRHQKRKSEKLKIVLPSERRREIELGGASKEEEKKRRKRKEK